MRASGIRCTGQAGSEKDHTPRCRSFPLVGQQVMHNVSLPKYMGAAPAQWMMHRSAQGQDPSRRVPVAIKALQGGSGGYESEPSWWVGGAIRSRGLEVSADCMAETAASRATVRARSTRTTRLAPVRPPLPFRLQRESGGALKGFEGVFNVYRAHAGLGSCPLCRAKD